MAHVRRSGIGSPRGLINSQEFITGALGLWFGLGSSLETATKGPPASDGLRSEELAR
jgi:hypothetical protein